MGCDIRQAGELVWRLARAFDLSVDTRWSGVMTGGTPVEVKYDEDEIGARICDAVRVKERREEPSNLCFWLICLVCDCTNSAS